MGWIVSPQKIFAFLTPWTYECDLIWEQSHWRYNYLRQGHTINIGWVLNHVTGERSEYNFGVDAGCLSIVNLEFADPKKIEEVRESDSLGIIIDQPCIGMQLNEDEGAFDIDVLIPAGPGERNSSHYVHIETAGYDDDEEDDWEDWNDPYDEEMEELSEDEY